MELNLPENFDIAFGWMKTLSRRFQNDRSLLEQYCEIAKQIFGVYEFKIVVL